MINSMVNIEGLENRRVIDFLKHSSRLGLPGLDLEALSEGHFGAPSVQNIVIHNVFAPFCFDFASKPCFLIAFCEVGGCVAWGSEGAWGGGKNERLWPDSTRGLGSEGVCGLGVGGCAGSVQK